MLTLNKIGKVHSCYPDRFGTPRQPGLAKKAKAYLEIYREFQPEISLQGLEEFSHLWVLFQFHLNTNARFHAKVHPPRLGGQTMGLFATRSPHRPNPLGMSLTKIEGVEKNGIWVSEIDLIDGTPIFDIKPYLPEIEAKTDARMGWSEKVHEKPIEIHWQPQILNELMSLSHPYPWRELKELIDQTLCLDPRPRVYKGYEEQPSHRREVHAVRFYHLDVHFSFAKANLILIERLFDLSSSHKSPRLGP